MPAPRKPPPPHLDAEALRRLARQAATASGCNACAELVCPGWETLPGAYDRGQLVQLGTLQVEAEYGQEASVREHHPRGSHGWSADAPVAPAWFPYNRCTVWQCCGCPRVFLRYTEYGGYYQDERIRALNDPDLVDDTPLPPQ
ncbi:MAG: hypothetical protein RIQ60_284 [Pseudomonadota bacterium]|jgi:fermentation-respiration switch protein FrsA (DUF1100 family)